MSGLMDSTPRSGPSFSKLVKFKTGSELPLYGMQASGLATGQNMQIADAPNCSDSMLVPPGVEPSEGPPGPGVGADVDAHQRQHKPGRPYLATCRRQRDPDHHLHASSNTPYH